MQPSIARQGTEMEIKVTRQITYANRRNKMWIYYAVGPDGRRFDNSSLNSLRKILKRYYPGSTVKEDWKVSEQVKSNHDLLGDFEVAVVSRVIMLQSHLDNCPVRVTVHECEEHSQNYREVAQRAETLRSQVYNRMEKGN